MKEIVGNLWDYRDKPGHVICITTNGVVTKDGRAVMGAGCAKQAAEYDPALPKRFGAILKVRGNHVVWLQANMITFPVKHHWQKPADLSLIVQSARELHREASFSLFTYILPRPGCGNGRRTWTEVKPLISFLPDNVHVITEAE